MNFVIFFKGHEGSSAIITHLNKHPKINIVGFEPFDQHVMKKPLRNEKLAVALDLTFKQDPKIQIMYKHYTDRDFPKLYKNAYNGFKMRPRNIKFIKPVLKNRSVKVFVLIRKDLFRLALSKYDESHNQFKLMRKKQDFKITVDLDKFDFYYRLVHEQLEEKQRMIKEFNKYGIETFPIYYETYCDNKKQFFANFFKKLDIDTTNKEIEELVKQNPHYKKVHDKDITKYVINHEELLSAYDIKC